jgi:hypothetical protein
MAKGKESKKVKTFYLKEENIDFLNQRAYAESTPDRRVSDDAVLDAMLDEMRASETSKPVKQKKSTAQAVSAPLAV